MNPCPNCGQSDAKKITTIYDECMTPDEGRIDRSGVSTSFTPGGRTYIITGVDRVTMVKRSPYLAKYPPPIPPDHPGSTYKGVFAQSAFALAMAAILPVVFLMLFLQTLSQTATGQFIVSHPVIFFILYLVVVFGLLFFLNTRVGRWTRRALGYIAVSLLLAGMIGSFLDWGFEQVFGRLDDVVTIVLAGGLALFFSAALIIRRRKKDREQEREDATADKNYPAAHAQYERDLARWRRTWICLRCGNGFVF